MSTEVLDHLRTMRESIAEALRKDPRYLTISALDKSIAEIAAVMETYDPKGAVPPPPAPPAV